MRFDPNNPQLPPPIPKARQKKAGEKQPARSESERSLASLAQAVPDGVLAALTLDLGLGASDLTALRSRFVEFCKTSPCKNVRDAWTRFHAELENEIERQTTDDTAGLDVERSTRRHPLPSDGRGAGGEGLDVGCSPNLPPFPPLASVQNPCAESGYLARRRQLVAA